jgi:hypothetical protein
MTPEELIQKISDHNGIQRKNRFSVNFSSTCGGEDITSNGAVPAIYATFGQRGVELTPDRNTGPGIGRNIPTNPTYESDNGLLIRFPVEQDWATYKIIQEWFNNLSSLNAGLSGRVTAIKFYDDCAKKGKVILNALTYNGNVACKFTFNEAFPAVVLPLEFDSEPNSGNSTYDVIFNFRKYVVE